MISSQKDAGTYGASISTDGRTNAHGASGMFLHRSSLLDRAVSLPWPGIVIARAHMVTVQVAL